MLGEDVDMGESRSTYRAERAVTTVEVKFIQSEIANEDCLSIKVLNRCFAASDFSSHYERGLATLYQTSITSLIPFHRLSFIS